MKVLSWDKSIFVLLLFASLMFVWPIPHTTSLRSFLMLVLLVMAIVFIRNNVRFFYKGRVERVLLIAWCLLIAWMLAQYTFLDHNLTELKDLLRELFIPILIFWSAFIVYSKYREKLQPGMVVMALFLPLLLHVLIIDLRFIYESLFGGVAGIPLKRHGGLLYPIEGSVIVNLCASFVFAEVVSRLSLKKEIMPISNLHLLWSLFLIFVASYVVAMRLGLIVFSSLIIFSMIVALVLNKNKENKKRVYVVLGFLIVVILLLGMLSYNKDRRWYTLTETFSIAWDVDTYNHWYTYSQDRELPKLSDGTEASHSNYMRIAWIRAGLDMIADQPIGYGYSENIFNLLIQNKYGYKGSMSESGFIDLGLSVGVPGLLIWYAINIYLFYLSMKLVRRTNGVSILWALIILDYNLRMLVESIFRDHTIQQYMFLLGVIGASLASYSEKNDSDIL